MPNKPLMNSNSLVNKLGPILGLISSGLGWSSALLLQFVVSLLATATIYRALQLENNQNREITKKDNLDDSNTVIHDMRLSCSVME